MESTLALYITPEYECKRSAFFSAGSQVFDGYSKSTICIDIESHLNLRVTTGDWRNTFERKAPKRAVVACHIALALQHVDFHTGLIVLGGREDLAFALGNSGIALDEPSHHATESLDAQAERRRIQ